MVQVTGVKPDSPGRRSQSLLQGVREQDPAQTPPNELRGQAEDGNLLVVVFVPAQFVVTSNRPFVETQKRAQAVGFHPLPPLRLRPRQLIHPLPVGSDQLVQEPVQFPLLDPRLRDAKERVGTKLGLQERGGPQLQVGDATGFGRSVQSFTTCPESTDFSSASQISSAWSPSAAVTTAGVRSCKAQSKTY